MSVHSKGYADVALKLIAFLAVLGAIAGAIGEQGYSIALSIAIAALAIGVVWERRDRAP